MKLTLPYPPSSNRYWRHVGHNVVVSKEAREYRDRVKLLGRREGVNPQFGPVVVHVDVFRPQRRGDLDNTLKVLLDALRDVAFVDDSQVVELHARRYDDRPNPRAIVTVEPCARGTT